MKKISIFCALILLVGTTLFAQVKAKDGVYFAQATSFDDHSWREQVILEVKGGKITKVNWNGVSNLPGQADKKTYAKAGKYGMSKIAKQGEWDKQAEAVEAWLLKTQDVGFSKFNEKGATDAISGATMGVSNFFTLVNKALASTPIAKGIYKKDGWFYKESANFDASSGWKDSVLITIVNGTIVDVLWNATSSKPELKSKLVESEQGRYGMEKVSKIGPWHQQAKAVELAIVKAQDPDKIALKQDLTTDAISGASIHATAVVLAREAVKPLR